MRRRTQLHRICGWLEYILSSSVLEYRQTDASHSSNQGMAHEIHQFCISISARTHNNWYLYGTTKVPKYFEIPYFPKFTGHFIFIYTLIRNLCGLKDAGKTWYDQLKNGLLKQGWQQSSIDEWIFTKNGVILVIYVDDAILIYKIKQSINDEITSLMKDCKLTYERELNDYLGTRFECNKYGWIELTQPRMIDGVLNIVGIDPENKEVKLHNWTSY